MLPDSTAISLHHFTQTCAAVTLPRACGLTHTLAAHCGHHPVLLLLLLLPLGEQNCSGPASLRCSHNLSCARNLSAPELCTHPLVSTYKQACFPSRACSPQHCVPADTLQCNQKLNTLNQQDGDRCKEAARFVKSNQIFWRLNDLTHNL